MNASSESDAVTAATVDVTSTVHVEGAAGGNGLNGVAGVVYVSMTAAGLLGYGAVLRGFVGERKKFAQNPFYRLVHLLVVGDLVTLLSQLIALPLVFTGEPLYGDGTLLAVMSSPAGLGFNIVFYTSFLIALNRFLVFTTAADNAVVERLFDTHIRLTVGAAFAFALLYFSITRAIGCPSVFDHQGFYFWTRCQPELSWFAKLFRKYSYYQDTLFIPLSMALMYTILYFVIKREHSRIASVLTNDQAAKKRLDKEINILIQSFLKCFVLELTILMYYLTPLVASGPALGVVNNAMAIVNSSVNPFRFLYFNTTIRNATKKAWGFGTVPTQVAPQQ